MTMPPLPAAGNTSWRDGWALAVHNAAATVHDGISASDLSATGTRSSSTYLRGDNTWATPAGGASTVVVPTGLTGDGTTNVTTAIQAAIDGLDDTNGGTVWLTAGRHNITTLNITTKNVTLAGPGILYNGTVNVGTGTGYAPVNMNTRIINGGFSRSAKSNTVNAIEIRNAHSVTVADMQFGMYRALINFPSLSLGTGNMQHSARIILDNISTRSWVDWQTGNIQPDYLVYINPNTTGEPFAVGDLTVSNCPDVTARISHIAGSGLDGLVLVGNTFFFETYGNADANKQSHVDLAGENSFISIVGNQLFEAGYESIKLTNPRHVTITGNQIPWAGQRDPRDAIKIQLDAGKQVSGIISGNSLQVPSKHGIGIYGTGNARNLVIGDNAHHSIDPNIFYYGAAAIPATRYRYYTDAGLVGQPSVTTLPLQQDNKAAGDAIGGTLSAVATRYSGRSATGGTRKVVTVTAGSTNNVIGTFKAADGTAQPFGGIAIVHVVANGGHGATYNFQVSGTSTFPNTLTQFAGSPLGETSGTWSESPAFTFNLTTAGVLRASTTGSPGPSGAMTFDVTTLGNLSFV